MMVYIYLNKLSNWLTQKGINHHRHALHGLVEDDREFLQTLMLGWIYQSVAIHGRLHKFVGFSDDFWTTQIHRILYDVKESEPALGDTVICHGGRYQLSFIISCESKVRIMYTKTSNIMDTCINNDRKTNWISSFNLCILHSYLPAEVCKII